MLAPTVAAFVASLLAFHAYRANAKTTRNETLLAKRREIFAEYVKVVQLNMIGHNNAAAYQSAFANLFIHGTDDVIRAVSSFHNSMADKVGNINSLEAAENYARMIMLMREDCFSSTKLGIEDLKKLLPFKH